MENNIKKKNDKSTVIVISLIAVILFIAVITLLFWAGNKKEGDTIVKMGEVEFSMADSDGEFHDIKLSYSLSGNARYIRRIEKEKAKQLVTDVIKKSDFEKLQGNGGMDYAKELVLNEFIKQMNSMGYNDSVDNIFIDKFTIDVDGVKEAEGKNKSEDVGNMFKFGK